MASFAKNGFTLIGLLAIAGLGYYLFVLNNDSSLLSDGGVDGVSEAQRASDQFLRELNEIKTFKLSDELFIDQRFRSFVDFSRPVPEQTIGRENPFAPVE